MTDKLKDKVLCAIEEENITPKSRWNFVLKDCTIWALAIFSLLVGALAFSLTLQSILSVDWELYSTFESNLFQFLMVALPFFWIVFLGIFIGFAFYNFSNTKGGYKSKLGSTVFASVIISLLTGTALYGLGISENTEEVLSKNSTYRKHVNVEHKLWVKPDHGRLIGRVVNVQEPITVYLQDPDKNIWRIDMVSSTPQNFLIFKEGQKVKVIGEKHAPNHFVARRLLPIKHHAPMPVFKKKMKIHVTPEMEEKLKHLKQIRMHMNSPIPMHTASSTIQPTTTTINLEENIKLNHKSERKPEMVRTT